MWVLSQVLSCAAAGGKQEYIDRATNRPGSTPVKLHLIDAPLDLALGPEFSDPHSSELEKSKHPPFVSAYSSPSKQPEARDKEAKFIYSKIICPRECSYPKPS